MEERSAKLVPQLQAAVGHLQRVSEREALIVSEVSRLGAESRDRVTICFIPGSGHDNDWPAAGDQWRGDQAGILESRRDSQLLCCQPADG